jgi:hypothetical protein
MNQNLFFNALEGSTKKSSWSSSTPAMIPGKSPPMRLLLFSTRPFLFADANRALLVLGWPVRSLLSVLLGLGLIFLDFVFHQI